MTPEEVSFTPIKEPRAIKVLEYLYLGGEAKLENMRVRMADAKDGTIALYYITTSENMQTNEKKEVVMGLGHANFMWFHKQCEKMEERDYDVLRTNLALARSL